jgi:hypothetical protein
MRPIEKGQWPVESNNPAVRKRFSPYDTAKDDLFNSIGEYCSFCECWSMSSSIAVEHVQAQKYEENSIYIYAHLAEDWENFILACVHCNSIKNTKNVILPGSYMPHITNTWHCFEYKQGGLVTINIQRPDSEQQFAEDLMNLVGLDRRPGKPQYSSKDRRWEYRRIAWELAERYLKKFEDGSVDQETICDLAKQKGFWSVWITVFAAHATVKSALSISFKGTFINFETASVERV